MNHWISWVSPGPKPRFGGGATSCGSSGPGPGFSSSGMVCSHGVSVPPAHAARCATVVALGAEKPPVPGVENFVRAVLVARHPPVAPGAYGAHADPMHFRKFRLRKPGQLAFCFSQHG